MSRRVLVAAVVAAAAAGGAVVAAAGPPPVAVRHAAAPVSYYAYHRDVDVVDRAGDAWPVGDAVGGWNAAGVVRLHLEPACRPGRDCVVVTDAGDETAPVGGIVPDGMTDLLAYPAPHWRVRLLNADRLPAAERQMVALHELGHALGLRHDTASAGSVMWPYTHPQLAPSAQDVTVLAASYRGVR